MRLIHLADLHIGKRVNEFPMIEDQRYVLEQVLEVLEKRQVDGVILAGDIYDRQIPPAEAVQLLDWFLTELADRQVPVYMVSGNHDSGERLAFGAKLLERSQVHVAAVYDGTLDPIPLQDEYGTVYLYLLPFVKPAHVRRALAAKDSLQEHGYPDDNGEKAELSTYHDAVRLVLERADISPDNRNLLVAHQLVTGAKRCESEEISVGGIDNVDAALFDAFDYVALGHIHGPQSMTRETIRYAGTLLKYSFSECRHNKSITLVELKEKGNVTIEEIPVKPIHDMRQIKGTYDTLMSYDFYKEHDKEDYLQVILTDEEEIPEAMGRLRTVYPNIMKLEYDNRRTGTFGQVEDTAGEAENPIDYFEEFYEMQNNQAMTEEQRKIVRGLVERIWG
ncbi:MAG: exonuclease SbcCD subunit D [Lachnospiraceae bacterium]|nr:exonuclease SbcCD subunit D [Lachnospiraceae bacterium]